MESKPLSIRFALHQQASDQLGDNLLGGAGEEGLGEGLGGLGGYRSELRTPNKTLTDWWQKYKLKD